MPGSSTQMRASTARKAKNDNNFDKFNEYLSKPHVLENYVTRFVDCTILEHDGKTLDFSKDATYFDIFEHLFKSDTLSGLEHLDEIPTIDLPTGSVDHSATESIEEQNSDLEGTTDTVDHSIAAESIDVQQTVLEGRDPLINLLDNHTTGSRQFSSEAEIFAFLPDGQIHQTEEGTLEIAGGMQLL